MGCTGSKPHNLLSTTIKNKHNNHAMSPQKGFILFNSKTIDYLKANENVINQKLVERCEKKVDKIMGKSTSRSLFHTARRTILSGRENSVNLTNIELSQDDENQNQIKVNISTLPRNTESPSSESIFKIACIKEATEFVLKYAINDFDIEDFKSTNHLSIKQIRKDITKKYSQYKISSDKLETSLVLTKSNYVSKTLTLKSNKNFSSETFKNILNIVIDEFGLFIQENFVVINEFNPTHKNENDSIDSKFNRSVEDHLESKNFQDSSIQSSDEDDLKLKEALELARQNFYKGKVSMVCLNKKGGYVVKEVADNTDNLIKNESIEVIGNRNHLNDLACSVDPNDEINVFNTTPLINIEFAENKDKMISNSSVKSLKVNESVNFNSLTNEDLQNKKELSQRINETIDLIVKYSTESARENSISIDSFLNKFLETKNFDDIQVLSKKITQNEYLIDLLEKNFENVKNILKMLQGMEKQDLNLIQKDIVSSFNNFDYVNKEFKTYLSILEDNLNEQLKKVNSIISDLNEKDCQENLKNLITLKDDNIVPFLEKNIQVRKCVEEIHFKLQNLSSKLNLDSNFSPMNKNFMFDHIKLNCDFKNEISDIQNIHQGLINKTDNNLELEVKSDILDSKQDFKEFSESKVEEVDHNLIAKNDVDQSPKNDSNIKNPASQESLASTLSSNFYSSTSSITPPGSILTEQINKKRDDLITKDKVLLLDGIEYQKKETDYLPSKNENIIKDVLLNKDIENWVNHEIELSSNTNQNFDSDRDTQKDLQSFQIDSNILLNNQILLSNNFQSIQSNESMNQNHITDLIDTNQINSQNNFISLKNEQIKKRASLDEELLNQINDVEKKVKYMNETCSENDDDDDDDDYEIQFDNRRLNFDPSFETEHDDENNERFFHPRRPSKIKSELRQNRAIDLQEEIKQISNVIQDLVQTINVKKSNSDINNSDNFLNDRFESNSQTDSIQRRSLTSKQVASSIPIRQKNLTKNKDSSIEDESFETLNISNNHSVVCETSGDISIISDTCDILNVSSLSSTEKKSHKGKKNSKSKFKSRLPVKK